MHHATDLPFAVFHQQRSDRVFLHAMNGLGSQRIATDPAPAFGHDIGYAHGVDIDVAFEHAAQIAIGEDAAGTAFRIRDHGHSHAFARHFQQGFIDSTRLRAIAEPLLKSGYGDSLMDIAEQGDGSI